MNLAKLVLKKLDWRFPGLVLLSLAVGAGTAGAETFRYDGSTATIEQSGGRGTSHSQVIRDQDGQTIITQDGNNTDITIQRRSDVPSSGEGRERPPSATDRFDRSWIEKRFSGMAPERGGFDDCPESTESSRREAFKQQMLERMRRPGP